MQFDENAASTVLVGVFGIILILATVANIAALVLERIELRISDNHPDLSQTPNFGHSAGRLTTLTVRAKFLFGSIFFFTTKVAPIILCIIVILFALGEIVSLVLGDAAPKLGAT